jgi:hypothetical protein
VNWLRTTGLKPGKTKSWEEEENTYLKSLQQATGLPEYESFFIMTREYLDTLEEL